MNHVQKKPNEKSKWPCRAKNSSLEHSISAIDGGLATRVLPVMNKYILSRTMHSLVWTRKDNKHAYGSCYVSCFVK